MNEDPHDLLQKGRIALEKKQLEKALNAFARAAFLLIFEENEPSQAQEAILLTISAYQQYDPSFSLEEGEDSLEQYFRVIRHWEDHREKSDERMIQEELTTPIPLYHLDSPYDPQSEGEVGSQHQALPPFFISVSWAQGPREEMEDAYCLLKFEVEKERKHTIHLFCILDGHGGSGCAQFAANYLPELLQQELKKIPSFNDLSLYNALSNACVQTDEQWKNLPFQKTEMRDSSGTTATLACLIDETALWVANVGDSGAVLASEGKAILLTESAKPTMPQFRLEIFRRGGIVAHGRVDGSLDMARSIGDLDHLSVSAKPTIKKRSLTKNRECLLILACDGLWDFIDPETAAAAVSGKTVKEASLLLRTLAYQRGSMDNVTVMVADLRSL